MFHVGGRPARRRALLALSACLVLVGCGGPRNYPVKGKVTYKENGRPLGGGYVLFQKAGDASVQASGDLEEDGSYELGNFKGMGAFEGEYEVLVQPRALEDNPEVLPIHPRFTNFTTSGLKYTVKPGANEFNIEVERNPRRR